MSERVEPGPARRTTAARRFERAAKRGVSTLLAAIVRPRVLNAAGLARLPVRRLLVVRPHNQLGDMVCALPALHALRRAWPDAHLSFVASPLSEALLTDHPDVDELLVFRKQDVCRPWRLAAFLWRLRFPRPDLAVVMTTVSFSTTSALLAWVSGARCRAGASSLPFGSQLSRAIYHLELPPGPEGVHEVEHNVAPLGGLGIAATVERPRLVPAADALQRVRMRLAQDVPGTGPLIVAHVGAGKRPNVWPGDRFAATLQALEREFGARIVLVEGPRDAAAVDAVARGVPDAVRWNAPLADTLALFSQASLVVSNDTGMAHVAAAVDAPLVVIFGPTDVQRWKPRGDHVRAVQSTTGSIVDVETAVVLHAARSMLGAGAAQTLQGPA